MRWSDDALKEMSRVPFFIRKMVKKRVEEFVQQQGSTLVLTDHLEECRQRFMKDQHREVKGYQLETCFGAKNCSNRVLGPSTLVEKLEKFFHGQALKEFLEENISGPIKLHHEFRVSVSFCPNACSRPQIVDMGIIGAVRPAWASGNECSSCGACCEECKEDAITLVEDAGPLVDCEKCLCCGHCIRVCPTSALEIDKEGFRIMIGGKLGRHPQLAHELQGIFSEESVLDIAEKIVGFYKTNSRDGERLGAVINRIGLDRVYKHIGIPL